MSFVPFSQSFRAWCWSFSRCAFRTCGPGRWPRQRLEGASHRYLSQFYSRLLHRVNPNMHTHLHRISPYLSGSPANV